MCGQQWQDSYITELSERELNEVKKTETHSHRPFRFGDGKVIHSTKKLKIPAKIGNIETDVVPADSPLLLSKASMKRAGTVPDMENDRAVMFNKPVKLDFTSSGHYCVNIMNNKSKSIQCDEQVLTTAENDTLSEKKDEHEKKSCEDEILTISEQMSSATKQRILLKLHKQFGHASADRLQRLLKSSGNNDTDCQNILQKTVSECQRYSKTAPKPAVVLPLASQYNETVAVDLHEQSNTY